MAKMNPLAAPKGSNKPTCEVCGQIAILACQNCNVTYWCGPEHQMLDLEAIHSRICEFVGPLRKADKVLGSHKDRKSKEQQQLQRKKHLMKLTMLEAKKRLNRGQSDLALPAALQAMKFAQEVYGLKHPNVVPAYLFMGTASLETGDLQQAENFFTQANWVVVKTPDCDDEIKSQLYRGLGELYYAKHNAPQALRHLADDVYHAAKAHGPDSIQTTGGYFIMAEIFRKNAHGSIADAMYQKVLNIWASALLPTIKDQSSYDIAASFDEAQKAEATSHILAIVDHFKQNPISKSYACACEASSMLHQHIHYYDDAEKFLKEATDIAKELKDSEIIKRLEELAPHIGLQSDPDDMNDYDH